MEVAKGGPHKGGRGELRIEVSVWMGGTRSLPCLPQEEGPRKNSLLGQDPQVGRLRV